MSSLGRPWAEVKVNWVNSELGIRQSLVTSAAAHAQPRQAAGGAEPEQAVGVFMQAMKVIAGQAVALGQHGDLSVVQAVEATAPGAQPDGAVARFGEGAELEICRPEIHGKRRVPDALGRHARERLPRRIILRPGSPAVGLKHVPVRAGDVAGFVGHDLPAAGSLAVEVNPELPALWEHPREVIGQQAGEPFGAPHPEPSRLVFREQARSTDARLHTEAAIAVGLRLQPGKLRA